MNNPMISVIMPVYNGEKYLKEAIDSILNQTFTNFEFIILNDGSTDRTEEIVLSYSDTRIHYVTNETNLQIIKTLNKGIDLSNGKYIARMDADDISLPTRLECQCDFLEANKNIGIVGSFYKMFGRENRVKELPINDEEIRIEMLFNSPFGHPTIMFRKDVALKNNLYYKNYQSAEDYYWVYSFSKVTKLANINKVLLLYRTHLKQISSEKKLEQINTADKIRCNILRDQFDVTIDDCSRHKLFSNNIAHDMDELQEITNWVENIIIINISYNTHSFSTIIIRKYKELFRKSARVNGLFLWPVYWNFKFRKRFTLGEFKFFLLLFFSWVKYLLITKTSI